MSILKRLFHRPALSVNRKPLDRVPKPLLNLRYPEMSERSAIVVDVLTDPVFEDFAIWIETNEGTFFSKEKSDIEFGATGIRDRRRGAPRRGVPRRGVPRKAVLNFTFAPIKVNKRVTVVKSFIVYKNDFIMGHCDIKNPTFHLQGGGDAAGNP